MASTGGAPATSIDSLTSSSILGSGQLMQSFYANHHFAQPDSSESFFSRKREDETGKKPFEASPIFWELGYAFRHLTSTDAHDFSVGLGWEVQSRFEVDAHAGYDTLPGQNYNRGQVAFHMEYFIPLGGASEGASSVGMDSRKSVSAKTDAERVRDRERTSGSLSDRQDDDDVDPDHDARTYYRNRQRVIEEPPFDGYRGFLKKRSSEVFPNLRLGANAEYVAHRLTPVSTTGTATTTGVQTQLAQYSAGPEAILNWEPGLQFRASGNFYGYSGLVRTFLGTFSPDAAATYVFPVSGVAAFVPQLMSFPDMVFDEGASYVVAPKWTVALGLNQVFYVLAGQGMGFGFAPSAEYEISRRFTLGLAVEVISAPAGTGAFGVGNVGFRF